MDAFPPNSALDLLLRALKRMAAPAVSGTIELHIGGGRCLSVKPHHPMHPDFQWGTPHTNQAATVEQQAVVVTVARHLADLAHFRVNAHLIITVVEGVPQLPIDLEYSDPVQLPGSQPIGDPAGSSTPRGTPIPPRGDNGRRRAS